MGSGARRLASVYQRSSRALGAQRVCPGSTNRQASVTVATSAPPHVDTTPAVRPPRRAGAGHAAEAVEA